MNRKRRRQFGQNFLDHNMAKSIAYDIDFKSTDTILEIGPGHGALSEHLLPQAVELHAVEIDEECVKILQNKFDSPKLQLYNCDFMDFDLAGFIAKHPNLWIVGNLPYNVATAILQKILPFLHQLQGVMVMTQLEVALRFCAEPHSKAYGSLSVMTKAHAQKRQILRIIGPEHFSPRPKVQSATFLLQSHKPVGYEEAFFEFVQKCFSHKRKQLTNSLAHFWPKRLVLEKLNSLNFPINIRAEQLTLQDFLKLYQIFQKL